MVQLATAFLISTSILVAIELLVLIGLDELIGRKFRINASSEVIVAIVVNSVLVRGYSIVLLYGT